MSLSSRRGSGAHRHSTAWFVVWWVAVLLFSLAAQVFLEELGLVTGEPLIAQVQLLSLLLILSIPFAAGLLVGCRRLPRTGGATQLAGNLAASLLAGVITLEGIVLGLFGLSALLLYVVNGGVVDERFDPRVALLLIFLSLPVGALLGTLGGLVANLVAAASTRRGSRDGD